MDPSYDTEGEFPPSWVKEIQQNFKCVTSVHRTGTFFHFSTKDNRDKARAFAMLLGLPTIEEADICLKFPYSIWIKHG